MSSKFSWTGKFTAPRSPARDQPKQAPQAKKARSEQDLCDELFALGDMLSCHIFSMDGEILGTNFGDIPVDDELKETFGEISARVWEDLRKGEAVGGPFLLTTIVYQNFKIIGIPFPEWGVGILSVVEDKVDAMYLKDRIVEFVKYWNSINRLRKRVKEG